MSSLLIAIALLVPDAAARRPSATAVPTVPSIEEVVSGEGFTPTPSQSEIYKPGAVLVPNSRGGHDVVVESCLDAEPTVSMMSQSSIATTLSGGVSARLNAVRGSVSAGVEKRLSFVDPEQRTVSLGMIRPTDSCAAQVDTAARFKDLSRAFVVHDVLVAIIQNTVCTKADAKGGIIALGEAEAAAFAECVQESNAQVPLGYKSVPLSKVISMDAPVPAAAAPRAVPTTPAVAVPSATAAPSPAASAGDGSGESSLSLVVGEYTSSSRISAPVRKQLDRVGLEWGLQGDVLVFTQVSREFLAADMRMTRWGDEAEIDLDPGVYTVSCAGLNLKSGYSKKAILRRGAWVNEGVAEFTVGAGERVELAVGARLERDWVGYLPVWMPHPIVTLPDGTQLRPCDRSDDSVRWKNYSGELKL